MSAAESMHVTIRLPLEVLFDDDVIRLYAVASSGSFGVFPKHIDFVSDLKPSVLSVWDLSGCEHVFGIDEGLLVKQSQHVSIVVRRGIKDDSLVSLGEQIKKYFLAVDDRDRQARVVMSRLEANMARGFTRLQRELP